MFVIVYAVFLYGVMMKRILAEHLSLVQPCSPGFTNFGFMLNGLNLVILYEDKLKIHLSL